MIEEIMKQIDEVLENQRKEEFFGRNKIFLNEKIFKMMPRTSLYSGIYCPTTYMGMKVAGTFQSDICNFILIEDNYSERKLINEFTTKELLEELMRRNENERD